MGYLPDIFESSQEFLEYLSKNIPTILYKYRDFNVPYHLKSLNDATIWFSSPKSLNDPFDIRVPHSINYDEVYTEEYYKNTFTILETLHPHLTKEALQTKTDELVNKVRSDPQTWFNNTTKDIQESDIWNVFGVFSLTHDPLNEMMWAHYASNGTGFCIGYNPLDIYFKCDHPQCGEVIYTEEVMQYNLLEDTEQYTSYQQFSKHKKWEYEKEYRFVLDIESEDERLVKLSNSAIKEVITGKNAKAEAIEEIINCLKTVYNSKVKLYQIEFAVATYGLRLKEIKY